MPEICRFYGIIIRMFFRDHLPPHFHVEYAEYKAKINIIDGDLIDGDLPKKALRLVQACIRSFKKFDAGFYNLEQVLMQDFSTSMKRWCKLDIISNLHLNSEQSSDPILR